MPSSLLETLEADMREVRDDLADIKATSKLTHDAVKRLEESAAEQRRWKDGDHATPGVSVRLDRVERVVTVLIWVVSAVATALVGAIASKFVE